jgi:hypothetical protein
MENKVLIREIAKHGYYITKSVELFISIALSCMDTKDYAEVAHDLEDDYFNTTKYPEFHSTYETLEAKFAAVAMFAYEVKSDIDRLITLISMAKIDKEGAIPMLLGTGIEIPRILAD